MTSGHDDAGHLHDAGHLDGMLRQLRYWLGDAFLDWVLAGGTPPLTQAQQEIVVLLHKVCSTAADRPGVKQLPARFLVSDLLGFDTAHATSILNTLRLRAGGDVPPVPPPTGDAVIDSLRMMAIQVYGELLLSDDTTSFSPRSSFGSGMEHQVVEAIKGDPDLPFDVGSGIGDSVSLLTSAGRGGGFQLAFLGPSLVGLAWELARLQEARPSAEALLREIPAAVATDRAAFTGKQATATGLVSVTGVLLPAGSELAFKWGQLRPAREGDHPLRLQRALGDRRIMQRLEDGTEIVITDAGDIMLVATVPFAVRVGEEFDPARGFPDLSSLQELEARTIQVRLALLLAWSDPQPPVLLPVWQRFIQPLTPGPAGHGMIAAFR